MVRLKVVVGVAVSGLPVAAESVPLPEEAAGLRISGTVDDLAAADAGLAEDFPLDAFDSASAGAVFVAGAEAGATVGAADCAVGTAEDGFEETAELATDS